PTERKVRATFELAAAGSFAQGGVVGTLNIGGARGYVIDSPFFRGEAEVRLDGRNFTLTEAEVRLPGAKLIGSGGGSLKTGLQIDFGVVVTNALALRRVPRVMRGLIGVDTILPGRSVEGSIIKRPGQKVQVKYKVLPIGIAQLKFLYRVLTGR